MGIFDSEHPFVSGVVGNGRFLTPKPSFPDFGDFDPCKGQTDSKYQNHPPNRKPWRNKEKSVLVNPFLRSAKRPIFYEISRC